MISNFKMSIILRTSLGHLLTQLLNILAPPTIPTESIDYWIANVSSRCAIKIIYYKFTNDFKFGSTHEIPVVFVPLQYHHEPRQRFDYLLRHKFFNSSLRFLKAECHFSIIYYKLLESFPKTSEEHQFILDNLMTFIANGFPHWYKFDSNTTYCLILNHRNESNDVVGLQSLLGTTRDMSIVLIYVSNSSSHGYTVYCRTPSTAFEVAAVNLVNKDASIVDRKFISSCSAHYKFVVLEDVGRGIVGVTDRANLDYEHEIIMHMLSKVNVSIGTDPVEIYSSHLQLPRVILKDYEKSLLFFQTFDHSIRIFTCYFSPVLSFHFYVSAFENTVWISIFLSGILLAVFLNYQIYHNISQTVNFSSVLFYFSIFM